MKAGFALNIERLYGPAIIRVAAKHLLRELAAELGADSHIDAARIKDNVILRGPDTSAGVAALAKSLMDAAGVTKCRKGAVMGLELLFTLPAVTAIDPREYFEQATRWAEQFFGVPVLSCVLHADEGSVHAHALLLPLVDGRMGGSDLHGGKAKLAAMQTSFHDAVGAPHGLPKYVPQKRLSAPVRVAAMDLARESLQANAALNDDIIDALLAPHAKDPAPLLLALGIAMPATQAPAKDFVSMMIAPCNPEKRSHIGEAGYRHIGKQSQPAPTVSLPDTCVGEGIVLPPNPAREQPAKPATTIAASVADQSQPSLTEIKVRAERKCGEMLRDSAERVERATARGNVNPATVKVSDDATPSMPTLAAIGITRDQSSRYQQLATLADQVAAADTRLRFQKARASSVDLLEAQETPAPSFHDQPAADRASHSTQIPGCLAQPRSAESSAHLDVSSSARISSAPAATGPAPCANGIRPHEDASKSGCISQGGGVSPPPAGMPSFGQTPVEGISNSGDTSSAGGDALKSQQVDHHAAGDYQRHRDDEQPADAWCADLGEFVKATGPPRGASQRHSP